MNAYTNNFFAIETLESRQLMSASGTEIGNIDSNEFVGTATYVESHQRSVGPKNPMNTLTAASPVETL